MAKKIPVNAEDISVESLIGDIVKNVKGAKTYDTEGLSCDIDHWISTGSTVLNFAMSGDITKGAPSGRVIEIFGEEGSGKSTIGTAILIGCQKAGGIAVVLDTEAAKNRERDTKQGLDPSKLIYQEQEDGETWTMEDVFKKIDELATYIRSKNKTAPVAMLWDSVAATTSEAEEDADYDENASMGSHARTISKSMRKLVGKLARLNITLILINQIRDKIGVKWGSKTETFGGRAIKFYSSIRLSVSREEILSKEEKGKGETIKKIPYGQRLRVATRKNKVSPPFTEITLTILYRGDLIIDDIQSTVDYLVARGKFGPAVKGRFTLGEDTLYSTQIVKRARENPKFWRTLKMMVQAGDDDD